MLGSFIVFGAHRRDVTLGRFQLKRKRIHTSPASADAAIRTFTALITIMARALVWYPHAMRIKPLAIQTPNPISCAPRLPTCRTPSHPRIPRAAPEYSRMAVPERGIRIIHLVSDQGFSRIIFGYAIVP